MMLKQENKFEASIGNIVRPCLKQIKKQPPLSWGYNYRSMVEHFPSMQEPLGSIPIVKIVRLPFFSHDYASQQFTRKTNISTHIQKDTLHEGKFHIHLENLFQFIYLLLLFN